MPIGWTGTRLRPRAPTKIGVGLTSIGTEFETLFSNEYALLAQRESTRLISVGSQVQSLEGAPFCNYVGTIVLRVAMRQDVDNKFGTS